MASWDLKNKATKKKKEVWELRNDTDLYTGEDKEWVEGKRAEVEHILEMQLMNRAWHAARDELTRTNVPAASTRKAYDDMNAVRESRSVKARTRAAGFCHYENAVLIRFSHNSGNKENHYIWECGNTSSNQITFLNIH